MKSPMAELISIDALELRTEGDFKFVKVGKQYRFAEFGWRHDAMIVSSEWEAVEAAGSFSIEGAFLRKLSDESFTLKIKCRATHWHEIGLLLGKQWKDK